MTAYAAEAAALPIKAQVLMDSYWDQPSIETTIPQIVLPTSPLNYTDKFNSGALKAYTGEVSGKALDAGQTLNLNELKPGTIVFYDRETRYLDNAVDFELYRSRGYGLPDYSKLKELGRFLKSPARLVNEGDHTNFKLSCLGNDLIKMCSRAETQHKRLLPGKLALYETVKREGLARFFNPFKAYSIYKREAWYGIVAPQAQDGSNELFSYPKIVLAEDSTLNSTYMQRSGIKHRPVVVGAKSVSKCGRKQWLHEERVTNLTVYDASIF